MLFLSLFISLIICSSEEFVSWAIISSVVSVSVIFSEVVNSSFISVVVLSSVIWVLASVVIISVVISLVVFSLMYSVVFWFILLFELHPAKRVDAKDRYAIIIFLLLFCIILPLF